MYQNPVQAFQGAAKAGSVDALAVGGVVVSVGLTTVQAIHDSNKYGGMLGANAAGKDVFVASFGYLFGGASSILASESVVGVIPAAIAGDYVGQKTGLAIWNWATGQNWSE
jgi:hypothetical protein